MRARNLLFCGPFVLGLSIVAAGFPALASPSETYRTRHRVPSARTALHRGRQMVEVPTGQRDVLAAYRREMAHTVELLYKPHTDVGHLLLRVGETFGDLGATRFARNQPFESYMSGRHGLVGFSFDVANPAALPAVEAEMRRELESLSRHNVPVFSSFSRTTRLRPAENGRLEILPPRNPHPQYPSFEARGFAEGELVHESGGLFIRSPNGVMVPARQVGDGLVSVEARSCTSWPTALLAKHAAALGIPDLGLRKDAKDLARLLMEGEGIALPNLVSVYTRTPGHTDLQRFAAKVGLRDDGELTIAGAPAASRP